MKKLISIALICGMIMTLTSCKITFGNKNGLSSENSSKADTTSVTTTTAATTKEQAKTTTAATTARIPYGATVSSRDNYFTLCYAMSTIHPKVNEEFKIYTKFTNVSKNVFKAGLHQKDKPVQVLMGKSTSPWGYEGNDTAINSTINPGQEFEQVYTRTFTEKGTYDVLIIADFKRDFLPGETSNDSNNLMGDTSLAYSSVSFEFFQIDVK